MPLSDAQRSLYFDEVRDMYDAYQDSTRKIERKIRAQIEAEIAAAQGDAKMQLSKALHDYYRKGLSKNLLREATRKYGNNAEFKKLWDAYTPDDDFQIAVGRTKREHRFEFGDILAESERRLHRVLIWHTDSNFQELDEPLIFDSFFGDWKGGVYDAVSAEMQARAEEILGANYTSLLDIAVKAGIESGEIRMG